MPSRRTHAFSTSRRPEVDRSDRLARLLGHFGDVRHGGRADLRNIPRGEELRRQFYKLMQFND